MPNPLKSLDQSFSSKTAAEEFFYGTRDKNLVSGDDIAGSVDFDLLTVASG